MGEHMDRRARKKAQTRELIRSVAQRMFDEQGFDSVTIADIARECDVAVQTVFNHFPTKEELFFDGRTHWVDGPAEAVASRGRSVSPLTPLREHLVEAVAERVGSHRSDDRRRYIATLEASDTLRAYERELVHQAETKLRAALLDAWSDDEAAGAPPDPESAALLVAAVWMATSRSLIVGRRPWLNRGDDPERAAEAAMETADRVLRGMERGAFSGLAPVRPQPARTDTGWPQDVRRAG